MGTLSVPVVWAVHDVRLPNQDYCYFCRGGFVRISGNIFHAQGLFLEGLNPYFIIQIGNIFS